LHNRAMSMRRLPFAVSRKPPMQEADGPGETVALVGEIVRMLELGLDGKRAALSAEEVCSVKVVAGACFGRCFPIVSARELERTMSDGSC